jgi:hypothetical protein
MSNNRLYIEDTETGERILFATSYSGGWDLRADSDTLSEWLAGRDMVAAYGVEGDSKSRFAFRTQNEK